MPSPQRPGRGRPRVTVWPVPDGRSLAGGMLVEASILARLLGIKILTLDASALVLPAGAAPSVVPPPRAGDRAVPAIRSSPRSTTGSPRRRLGEALRSIDEGAALLEEARKNRSLL